MQSNLSHFAAAFVSCEFVNFDAWLPTVRTFPREIKTELNSSRTIRATINNFVLSKS
jgi:hypothetical protein